MTVEEREHSKSAARRRRSWGSGSTMLDRIFDAGSSFDFYQAVKILSHLQADSTRPPAHGSVPVRFRSRMGWDFPGSDIHHISPPNEHEPYPQVLVNFLGLYTSVNTFTEVVAKRSTIDGEWKRWAPLASTQEIL